MSLSGKYAVITGGIGGIGIMICKELIASGITVGSLILGFQFFKTSNCLRRK